MLPAKPPSLSVSYPSALTSSMTDHDPAPSKGLLVILEGERWGEIFCAGDGELAGSSEMTDKCVGGTRSVSDSAGSEKGTSDSESICDDECSRSVTGGVSMFACAWKSGR